MIINICCCDFFISICCISCFAVTSFILFAVLVVLLQFHFGILYYRSHSVVVSFAMLAVTVILLRLYCCAQPIVPFPSCLNIGHAWHVHKRGQSQIPYPLTHTLVQQTGSANQPKRPPQQSTLLEKKSTFFSKKIKVKKRLLIIKIS